MSYIAWGDMELLLRTHLTDDELIPFQYAISEGTVTVIYGDEKYPLAVSDFRNNAIDNPDATDINDTLQRAFVKAAARHYGIGHKLYEASFYKQEPATSKRAAKKSSQVAPTNNSDFF